MATVESKGDFKAGSNRSIDRRIESGFEAALREVIAEAVERELAPVLDLLERLTQVFAPDEAVPLRARPRTAIEPSVMEAIASLETRAAQLSAFEPSRIQVLKPRLPRAPREPEPLPPPPPRMASPVPPVVRRKEREEREEQIRAGLSPQLEAQRPGIAERVPGGPVAAPAEVDVPEEVGVGGGSSDVKGDWVPENGQS